MTPAAHDRSARRDGVEEFLSADVVVVGAGVAGSMPAYELSRLGRSVLVLEAGPRIDRLDALRRFRASPGKASNSPYEDPYWAPQPNDDDPNAYYVQAGPMPFMGLFIRGVGGTSWHWTGHAERFAPSDFRMRTLYGVAVDWPISYDDLVPYYLRVEREWGVAGDPVNGIGPDRDGQVFPLPPVPLSYLDRQVAKAVSGTGLEVGPYPHCRNSVAYDDRPQCCGNASCRFLCPIGAKYDASVHVHKAERLGARVADRRVVHRVEVGADGMVSGLRYRRADGVEGLATGRRYVVAAHAIETPKLLLMSVGERTPDGVANSSGQVGRNLMGQIDANTQALAPMPLYPYRGPVSATGGLKNFREGEFRRESAALATFFINGGFNATLGPAQRAQALIARGIFGVELNRRLADETMRELLLNSSAEVLPDPENRVVPDWDRRDAFGMPRPRIHFRMDAYTQRGVENAYALHERIMDAMGIRREDMARQAPSTSGAIIAGTARMGADPKTSVVNPYCRSHDHPNLYVIGTCSYPTTPIASPSMTAAALAIRAAEQIHAELNNG
jgi:choline dehydrogenase-like flavoprotein